MKVIKAKSAGFCFGVKRAVDTVYEQVEENQNLPIYTYGPIIHNEEVVKDLEQKGAAKKSWIHWKEEPLLSALMGWQKMCMTDWKIRKSRL